MLPQQQILTECKHFTKPIDILAEMVYNSIIGRGKNPNPNNVKGVLRNDRTRKNQKKS